MIVNLEKIRQELLHYGEIVDDATVRNMRILRIKHAGTYYNMVIQDGICRMVYIDL